MDIIKFILWWWNKRNHGEKWLVALISGVVSLVPGCYFFGPIAIVAFLGTIVAILLGSFMAAIYRMVMVQWRKFCSERDAEAELILRKLKGGR